MIMVWRRLTRRYLGSKMATVEQRIAKLHDEVKAQKVAGEIAYSTVLKPENTPSVTKTERIDWSRQDDKIYMRERFRFERTDGKTDAPLVNFAFDFYLTPDYATYQRETFGITVTGYDIDYVKNDGVTGYIYETGPGYVDFYVDVDYDITTDYHTDPDLDITMTVQAISPVEGTLTATRLI